METKRVVLNSAYGEHATSSERKAKLLVVVLCLGLPTLAALPFFFMGDSPNSNGGLKIQMPVTHDMILHFDQMKSFYSGLSAGEIYPRWEADTNRGFGAPTTSYYPPGVYYLTSAIYVIAGNWMLTLLITHLLMMIASATAIYLYAHQFMNRFAAITAMTVYVFLPYHLIDQYQRGAMAELMGFIWMPLMLLFGERLFRRNSPLEGDQQIGATKEDDSTDWKSRLNPETMINAAGLAASFGAFLWSHTATAYQFMLSFGLYAMLLAWMRRDWRGFLIWIGAMALGLGLSAAYLYPAFMEQDFIRRDYVSAVWPYHKTYIFAHALRDADAGRSFYNWLDFTWSFHVFAILLGALSLLVLEPQFLRPRHRLRYRVLLWVFVGLFASFMMTKASYPLGRIIPKIEIGIFTWRMLSITTMMVALICGACAQAAYNAFKRQRAGSNSIVSVAALIIVAGAVFTAVKLMPPLYRGIPFETAKEHLNFVMIPQTAPEDPLQLPKVNEAEFAQGKGSIALERWEPEHRSLRIEINEPDKLLIRTFNFPGWTATLDGEPATIYTGEALRVEGDDGQESLIRAASFQGGEPRVDSKPVKIIGSEPLGDIILNIPAGSHYIRLDYLNTDARRTGIVMTITSMVLLLAILLLSSIKRWRS